VVNRRLIVIVILSVLGIIGLAVLISASRTMNIRNITDRQFTNECPPQLIDPSTGDCMPWNTTEEECQWAIANGHLEYYQSTGRCMD